MLFGVEVRRADDAHACWNLRLKLRVDDGISIGPWSDYRDAPTVIAEITCVFEGPQHTAAAGFWGVMKGNEKCVFQVVDYFAARISRDSGLPQE